MKTVCCVMRVLLPTLLIASCVEDKENYRAGFEVLANKNEIIYANTISDSLFVLSYGNWQIRPEAGAEWCNVAQLSGKGNVYYAFGIQIGKNYTGKERMAPFTIYDTAHTDASVSWSFRQQATRGDGSMGNAALVKSIVSSDGYEAQIAYDSQDRPVEYILYNSSREVVDRLVVAYNERQGSMTVDSKGTLLEGVMDSGFQSVSLTGAADSIGYTSQYYANGMPISYNYTFNLVAKSHKGRQAYSYLLANSQHPYGQSLSPDSLHLADSVKYVRQWSGEQQRHVEGFKMEYSGLDNRFQTVDVNQLLLGFEEYHPMLLLSMFRYARSTSIVSRALSNDGNIEVSTVLNTDKSVKTMTVTRGTNSVTYTFKYQ